MRRYFKMPQNSEDLESRAGPHWTEKKFLGVPHPFPSEYVVISLTQALARLWRVFYCHHSTTVTFGIKLFHI